MSIEDEEFISDNVSIVENLQKHMAYWGKSY